MKSTIVLSWFLLLMGVAPPLLAQEELTEYLPENPRAGWSLFTEKHCIRCHSVQGVGGRNGPDLGDIWLGSFVDIASSLWNHFPRMREAFQSEQLEWPTLTEVEGKNLITFIYFLNFFDKTANAEIGEKIFHEKNCFRCHSVGGKGGDIGPKLDKFQIRHGAPFITAELWNKGPKMMREMAINGIPRPVFQERDVIDILAFIRNKGLDKSVRRLYLPAGSPRNGKDLFQRKSCGKCHAIRGTLKMIGPDLGLAQLKGSFSQILSEMWNHGASMWPRMKKEGIPFPNFTPQEMSDLLSFLYFLDFSDKPGSAKKGETVFREKECALCHFPERPGGDTLAPNLAEAGLDNPFKVLTEMWNHAPAIEEVMREEDVRWPLLNKEEMSDLIAYILAMNKG